VRGKLFNSLQFTKQTFPLQHCEFK